MSGCEVVHAAYASAVDMLYIFCKDNGSLDFCHEIEDTPSGITVMYDNDGSVIGAEVPDFAKRYAIPATINVDAVKPFDLVVNTAEGLTVA